MKAPPKLASESQAPPASRLTGLDAARALAIFGMVIVNVGAAAGYQGVEGMLVRLTHGRAAILFIVLAGIGVSLLVRSVTARGGSLWSTVLWRAGILLVLGLGLQLLPVGVNVILALYAALFLMALTTLRWSSMWLLSSAVVILLAGPVVYILVSTCTELPTGPAAFGQNPVEILASVTLTGPYPMIVWAAPFLFGMWLGRLDLSCAGIQFRFMAFGAIAAGTGVLFSRGLVWAFSEPDAALGFSHLVLSSGHSEMPLWLISAVGSSTLIIGLMLVITPKLGAAARCLTATGQLALTCYSLHLIAIAVLVRPESAEPHQSMTISLIIIAGLITLSTAWRAVASRGPLEALLRIPSLLKR
ncbi:DUF418 domain-containing protein [Nesterenkonia muleiensis]|uniref:DUF418 domain-containing protein n=1 Tax=Nesterenkonia muleiensis TaxID=2282648 RepID=UPI000E764F54|nr:DUF418 domain-containing protein [Nesterenkonia muleiensis]